MREDIGKVAEYIGAGDCGRRGGHELKPMESMSCNMLLSPVTYYNRRCTGTAMRGVRGGLTDTFQVLCEWVQWN